MHEPLPDDDAYRHEHELKYYQWTPFILLLMAILFYIPHQCWRGLSLRSGVDLKDLIEAAQTFRSANIRHEDKLKLLEYLTSWLNSYCSNVYRLTTNLAKQGSQSSCKARCRRCLSLPLGIYTGNYLIISYLLIKFLYLFNSLGQIFLLNGLLGRKFWFYGIEIIHRYWTKQIGLLQSGNEYFPKVVSSP
jgi:innexin